MYVRVGNSERAAMELRTAAIEWTFCSVPPVPKSSPVPTAVAETPSALD